MSLPLGSINISNKLFNTLKSMGIKYLSPIQEKACPLLLKNESLICKAPTGSGKTLTYLIPILNDLEDDSRTEAVIILPTKVLCNQLEVILKEFKKKFHPFSYSSISEGTSSSRTKINAKIIISTPSQFLFNLEKMNLKYLKRLIVDEGDMILFGGFEKELNDILSLDLKAAKSLFTASIDEHLDTLVKKYMGASKVIDVSEKKINADTVSHCLVDIRHVDKNVALVNLLKYINPYKTMVFVSTKNDLLSLDKYLNNISYPHSLVHGDMSKRDQKREYKDFKDGVTHLMIGSDIIARGVDIEDVTEVISLDLPLDLTYYFHRAGRTGRFDKKGISYVFYNNDDTQKAKELVKKGVKFTYYSLKNDGLKEERDLQTVSNVSKVNNIFLEKEIKKNIAKLRYNKVKPCYKKKIKVEIERNKERHKKKIIQTNLRKKENNN